MKFVSFPSRSKPSTVKSSRACHSANLFSLSVPHLIPISFSNKPSAPSLSPSELIITKPQSRSDRPDCTPGSGKSQNQLLLLTLSLFALAYIQNVRLFCRGNVLRLCATPTSKDSQRLFNLGPEHVSSHSGSARPATAFRHQRLHFLRDLDCVKLTVCVCVLKTLLECTNCLVKDINERMREETSQWIKKNRQLKCPKCTVSY